MDRNSDLKKRFMLLISRKERLKKVRVSLGFCHLFILFGFFSKDGIFWFQFFLVLILLWRWNIFVADLFPFPLFSFPSLGPYEDGKPDATFSFTDNDFLKIATGKMNPQIAFMRWDRLLLVILKLILIL